MYVNLSISIYILGGSTFVGGVFFIGKIFICSFLYRRRGFRFLYIFREG